jgi:transposase
MTHIAGRGRSQTLLLPESVDEYVDQDDPVRFVDALVDGPDLAAAGFIRVMPKTTGCPGYAPDASGMSPIGTPKRQGAFGLAR